MPRPLVLAREASTIQQRPEEPDCPKAAVSGGRAIKLEHAADDQLKAMVGKRVEVTGRVDAEAGDAAGAPPASAHTNKTDKVVGHDRIDLPEFEVTSIKAVSGSCPAKPTTRQ
jgi:hypothetical protein